MGTWSNGILADDDAQEVSEEYQRLLDEGKDPAAIRKKLERAWRPGTDDDGAVFWLALAQCQWNYGVLDKDVLTQVKEIAEQERGLVRWREQGPRVAAGRQKAVRAFLKKIQTPKMSPRRSVASNPKPAKKAPKKRSIYQPGDCLAVRLSDSTYGAILVLPYKGRMSQPVDYVGLLNYHGADPPALSVFGKRRWLGRQGPIVKFCLANTHRKDKEYFEVVGTTPLRDDDPRYEGSGPYSVVSWAGIRCDLAQWHEIPE